jgi:hypothetical protein
MDKRIKSIVINVDITTDDAHGCITATHQCGVCCFNQVCSQSVKAAYTEVSASDWLEVDPASFAELRFND